MAVTVTGYNYFGSYAIAICLGPVKKLLSISNGDTVIFEGPVDSSSADADGKSTISTTLGTIDFYWGLDDQNVNAELGALEIDYGTGAEPVEAPAYRRVCYAVCHDIAFGQQVTPPTLQFEIATETEGLSISQHELDGDAVLSEAIYDYLVNPLYGAEVDSSLIETTDFEEAAETLIAEDLAASPNIDSNENIRETLSRILSHIDGAIFFQGGKIRFKLVRPEDPEDALEITAADLLDEPQLRTSQWDDTWNQTRLTWRDRENKWEEAVENYTDPANAAIVGQASSKDFHYPWFTRRGPAIATAKRLGIEGGLPPAFWSLSLKPVWRTLTAGTLVKLTFAGSVNVSDLVLRVDDVRINSDLSVDVDAHEERTRDSSNDYTPPEIVPPNTHNEPQAIVDLTPRIAWLPPALLNDDNDGVLIVARKSQAALVAAFPYFAWNESSPGYRSLNREDSFPSKGTMLSWHQVRTDKWLFRVQMDSSADLALLQSKIAAHGSNVFAVVGHRKFKTVGTPQDEHQMMAVWLRYNEGGRFEEITGNTVDIELSGAVNGTTDLSLEELLTNGDFPTEHVYFGVSHDIWTLSDSWPSEWKFQRTGGNPATGVSSDTDQKRYIKVPAGNHEDNQDVIDVTAVYYDRNDTTMCPDGTLSRDWGEAVETTYEIFNTAAFASLPAAFEDIDAALMAIFNGTATADQELLAEHIDAVLGSMLTNGHLYYNV